MWHCVKNVCIRTFLFYIFAHSDWIRRETRSMNYDKTKACLEAPLSLKNRKCNSSVLKNLAWLFSGTINILTTEVLEQSFDTCRFVWCTTGITFVIARGRFYGWILTCEGMGSCSVKYDWYMTMTVKYDYMIGMGTVDIFTYLLESCETWKIHFTELHNCSNKWGKNFWP